MIEQVQDGPMDSCGTTLLHGCDRCGAARILLARTIKGLLCADCWRALSEPGTPEASMTEQHETELRTRKRMQQRGGEDAHRVRAGRT